MWDNTHKNTIREEVCRTGKKPYNCILLLPSDEMLDIKQLIQSSQITHTTKIVAVERDIHKAKVISKKLAQFNAEVLTKDLVEVDLRFVVENFTKEKFDFVYADTCSQLNSRIIEWLMEVSKHKQEIFTQDGKLIVAFCPFLRNGKHLMEKFWEKCRTNLNYIRFDLAGKEINAEADLEAGDISFISRVHYKTIRNILSLIFGPPDKEYLYKGENAKTTMSVFEYSPNAWTAIGHHKFLRDVISEYRAEQSHKSAITIDIKPKEKPAPVELKQQLFTDISNMYRRHLAAWKMVATKKNLSEEQTKAKIIEESFKFVAANGYDKSVIDILVRSL